MEPNPSSFLAVPREGSFRIELFDGLRVSGRRQSITSFRTQKTAALLAYLAFHRGRSIARDHLLELLWPEGGVELSRRSLNTALWSIRQTFSQVDAALPNPLRSDRSFVALDAAQVRTDVGEFTRLLRAADQTHDPTDRVSLLRQAVGLYRGELLRGYYEDWIFPEQSRLASEYRRLARDLVEQLRGSAPREALEHACAVVRAEPTSEADRLTLMTLYTCLGDRAAALQEYTDFRRVLLEELGTKPGTGIEALAHRLKAGTDTTLSPAPLFPHTGGPPMPKPASPGIGEPVGGAVPPESPLYVVRPADAETLAALRRSEAVILVRGSRQCGKSSLLARSAHEARRLGFRVAVTDFAALAGHRLQPAEQLIHTLTESLVEQLELVTPAAYAWDADLGCVTRFRSLMRRVVLAPGLPRLMWILDGVDALFGKEGADEFFGLLRSWYNERAMEPESPWHRLTQVLAYATEAHLFIRDLNQSPFNVGVRVELGDFTHFQIEELNARLGAPLSEASDLRRLLALTGGHPYLVRRALEALARREVTLSDLESAPETGHRVFAGHLESLLHDLLRDPELCAAVERVLSGSGHLHTGEFYRLRGAGLFHGASPARAQFRCELYRRYLEMALPGCLA